jgi:hypothetical protein
VGFIVDEVLLLLVEIEAKWSKKRSTFCCCLGCSCCCCGSENSVENKSTTGGFVVFKAVAVVGILNMSSNLTKSEPCCLDDKLLAAGWLFEVFDAVIKSPKSSSFFSSCFFLNILTAS